MSEMKRCPFCGKHPKIEGKVLRHNTKRCLIGDITIVSKTKEQAIEMWNRRDKYEYKQGKKAGARSFAKLVKQMREAQKAYFRNAGNPMGKKKLAESKKLEAQVDRSVEAVLS